MDEPMLIMKKKKIAVFVNGWTTDFIETVLEGIRQEAAKDCVDIFVFLTYVNWGDPAVESKSQLNVFHLPKPDDFDGAIILANTFNMQDEMDRIKKLFIDKGLPVVSTEVKIPGVPFVGTNNQKGMTELCDHILDEHDVKSVVYGKVNFDDNNKAGSPELYDVTSLYYLNNLTNSMVASDGNEARQNLDEFFSL